MGFVLLLQLLVLLTHLLDLRFQSLDIALVSTLLSKQTRHC